MIVRPIRPEELETAHDIARIAFVGTRPQGPQPPQSPDAHIHHRAAFDDEGRMTASLLLLPYTVQLAGHAVGMGGIGGVASLPETRRQGNVRALFEAGLREMYERGMVFSALYPFSHAYYRQFGYEFCCARRQTTFEFAAFANCKPDGSFRQWMPGEDDAPLRAIYAAFTQNANLAVRREDKHWRGLLNADPFERRQYTYLWLDPHGTPRAYAVFRVDDSNNARRKLIAQDIAASDPQALHALFGLLRSMGAAYKEFVWDMPTWLDPNTMVPEPYDVAQSIRQAGMARLINVAEALKLLCYPDAPGAFTLRVRDPQLPENDGVWRVAFAAGAATDVSRAQADTVADWTLDITTATRLILGTHDIDGLLWSTPGLETPRNIDTFRRAFPRRRVYLADFF